MAVTIQITTLIAGILSLIFGVLILSIPKLLRYVVGIYLLLLGLLQILGSIW